MTDYMKEAERLSRVLEDIAQTALRGVENEQIRGHLMDAAALLAHIQRGAVPEGDDGKRVLREVFALCEDTEAKTYEEPGDFARGRRFEAKGIARAIGAWYQEEFCGRTHMGEPAAPAPDHFRDAAEMVPVYCTPTEHEGRIVYEHTDEPTPNADGFVLYAPVPDQFRNAAKMMAVQPRVETFDVGPLESLGAEVPAPAEVPMLDVVGYVERWGGACRDCADESGVCPGTGLPCGGQRKAIEYVIRALQYGVKHGYITDPLGAACRAAGEAAGYARGLAEAGDRIRRGRKILDAALRGEVK